MRHTTAVAQVVAAPRPGAHPIHCCGRTAWMGNAPKVQPITCERQNHHGIHWCHEKEPLRGATFLGAKFQNHGAPLRRCASRRCAADPRCHWKTAAEPRQRSCAAASRTRHNADRAPAVASGRWFRRRRRHARRLAKCPQHTPWWAGPAL